MLFRWAWLLFFFSGLTGLIYEILWTRRLTLVFGHSILAVSTVVTAYMGGLAVGSWLGGRWSDRKVRAATPGGWFVRCYGLLEGFVGLWGAASLPLLGLVEKTYFHLSAQGMDGLGLSLLVFGLSLMILLPPTLAMGATLPMVGCLFSSQQSNLGTNLSRLYSINTWGAVCGASLAGFILLPWLGLRVSIAVAAAINLGIAAFAWNLGHQSAPAPLQEERPTTLPSLRLPIIFGITGFASMVLQIGWTRGLALCLGGAVYSFSTILVVFLSGIALGSLLYPKVFGHRQLGWHHLAGLCLGLALTSALSIFLVGHLPLAFSFFFPWVKDSYAKVLLMNVLLSALVLLPPTLLMGLSFPLVTQLYHRYSGSLGGSIGNIYAANTLGCIFGSFGAGFFGLPFLGVENSLKLAVTCNLLAAALAALPSVRPRLAWLSVAFVLLTWSMPRWKVGITNAGVAVNYADWRSLLNRPEPYFYADGLTCSVSLSYNLPDSPNLRVNGKVDASLGLLDRINMNLVAIIPLLYADQPERVGVVGLGGGLTLAAAAGSPSVARIECAELEKSVIDCQRFWAPYVNYVDQNPKVKLLEADGRTFILGNRDKFDIIINEPSNPWIAGIGNLYTQDFFRACKAKLNPKGIFVQWVNLYAVSPDDLRMVLRTFFSIYPKGEIWLGGADLMLIGGDELHCRPERLEEYLRKNPAMACELAEFGFMNADELIGQFICPWSFAQKEVGAGPLNTDDRPLLEYSAPRSLYRPEVIRDNLSWVLRLRSEFAGFPSDLPEKPETSLRSAMGNFACNLRDAVKVTSRPEWPEEYRRLFDLFSQGSESAPVPSATQKLLADFPEFWRGRLEWARRALETRRYAQTLELLKPIPELSGPEEYLRRNFTAEASMHLREWQQALPHLQALYQMRPRSKTASDLATCHRQLGQFELALEWSERAMKANPYDHRAWLVRGLQHTREGHLAEAEQALDEAIKLCPFGLEAWLQLAALKAKQNKPAEAKSVLMKARRVCDDDADRQIDEILNRLGP